QIRSTRKAALRQVLILALGEFSPKQLTDSLPKSAVPELLSIFRDDVDPGVHGAAEWLLRRLGKQAEMKVELASLSIGKPQGQRRWYSTGQGQTLMLIEGRKFQMGSPVEEKFRIANEKRHWKSIDRTLAVASAPVTVAEYQRFLQDPKWEAKDPNPPSVEAQYARE